MAAVGALFWIRLAKLTNRQVSEVKKLAHGCAEYQQVD